MVGLSVVLEGSVSSTNRSSYGTCSSSNCYSSSPQVVNKASMIIKTSPTSPTPSSPNPFSRTNHHHHCSLSPTCGFLDSCFLCQQKLLPGKDIYMYKGDRAFCSEECRWRQMYMDEEETSSAKMKPKKRDNCSMAAIKPPPHHHQEQHASPSSPSSSRSSNSSRKGASKRGNGFVY